VDVEVLPAGPGGVRRAVELLGAGLVVGFPTDTVYGLAALAGRADAVERIFEAKGRPRAQPLVLMVHELGRVGEVAEVGERERRCMERWWPGPLTLVLRAREGLEPPLVTGAPPTVGVRIPDHPAALALLAAAAAPLATTSANRSGEPEAMTAQEAARLVGVAAVLDGGRAPGGIPSTLLDLSGREPRILREGPVSGAELLG
jgi:L-threonylcarbamoyladenylate synthase